MMAVNDAKANTITTTSTAQARASWDAIMHTTNLVRGRQDRRGRGFGWCGRGVALRAAGLGANVIVTEVDPFKALDATMQG
jgi:adenosylhomocysteinase